MKKCLLSLAVMLGAYTFASADTVTLNVNDAANFTGGTMTEERAAGTNSEKDSGEAKHYSPLSGFTIGDFTFGLTTTHATSSNAWYAAMSTNTVQQSNVRVYAKNATATVTITAPEGATMTAITAVQNQVVAGTNKTSPTLSANTGEVVFSGKNISWTGSANSVTVTIKGSSDYGNIRFTEFEITYEKAAGSTPTPEYTYTSTPATGTYASLSKVEIKFSAHLDGAMMSDWSHGELINLATNAAVSKFDYIIPECDVENQMLIVDLRTTGVNPQPFSTPGDYELYIPAGKYALDGKISEDVMTDSDTTEKGNSPEIRIRYTIDENGSVTPIALTVLEQNPTEEAINAENGAWSEAIVSGTLISGQWSVNTACTAKATMAKDGTVFSELAANDQNGFVVVAPMEGAAEANLAGSSMVQLVFSPETGASNGLYTMVIPEGFLTNNGVPNAEYTYTWTVGTPSTVVDFTQHLTQIVPDDDVEGMTPADVWGEGSYMVMAVLDGEVAINPAATGTITLKHDGQAIGVALSATASEDNLMIIPGNPFGASPMADDADAASEYTIGMTFLQGGQAPTAGDYVLSIPEGFFTFNGAEMSAYTKTWTIKRVIEGEYGTVPAAGEQITTPVSDFDVIFPAASSVTLTSGRTASEVTIVNGETTIKPLAAMASEAGLGTGISFFSTARTEALGEWTVTVPAGVLSVDGTVYDKEIKWSFTMVEPAKVELNIDPAEGVVTPDQLMTVKLIYDGATSFQVAEEGTYMVMLEGKSASTGFINLGYEAAVIDNGIQLSLPTGAQVAEGEWVLNVYPNVFEVDGEWNAQITVNYTVKEGGSVTPPAELAKPTSNPAEGLVENGNALDRIVLTLADNAEATALGEADTYQVNLVPVVDGQDGISVRTYTVGIGDNANEIILTAEGNNLEPLTTGEYKLVISANAYFVGETGNSAYTFTYNVDTDSVDGIFADDSVFNAYTLTGICVIANGTAADVDLLPAGLYIINGKKVLIRK